MRTYVKKATLLIRNIHKIYPMDIVEKQPCVVTTISHAFLAIHHDYILAMGDDDPSCYIDKDTIIIEGNNLIAVPAFIDMNVNYPISYDLKKHRDILLKMRNHIHCLSNRGVTTIHVLSKTNEILNKEQTKQQIQLLGKSLEMGMVYDVLKDEECVNPLLGEIPHSDTFTLTTGDMSCDDILLCARLLYRQGIQSSDLLKSLTLNPAKALKSDQIGVLAVNKQADFLLIQAESIDELFSHMGSSPIQSVYKAGILVNHHKN